MGAHAGLETKTVFAGSIAGGTAVTLTGAAVDTAGYQEAIVILTLGIIAATGTLDVKVQDCATVGGIYVDVPGAVFSQKVDADDSKTYVGRLKLDGNLVKRFIKLVGTAAVAAAEYGAVVQLSGNQYNPQDVTPVAFTV